MKVTSSLKNRLLLLLGVVLLIALLRPLWGPRYDSFFNARFNSQWIHLRQIEQHIQNIHPQWQSFTNENPGCAKVQLFAYTGGDGMFGASGEVVSDDDLLKLRKFMASTSPPRPIYVNFVLVFGPELIEAAQKQAELGGTANGSQPTRSETNRTSSAAGSRR